MKILLQNLCFRPHKLSHSPVFIILMQAGGQILFLNLYAVQ